jgi:hypothetical protein
MEESPDRMMRSTNFLIGHHAPYLARMADDLNRPGHESWCEQTLAGTALAILDSRELASGFSGRKSPTRAACNKLLLVSACSTLFIFSGMKS